MAFIVCTLSISSFVFSARHFSSAWLVHINRLNELTLLVTSWFLMIQTDLVLPPIFRVQVLSWFFIYLIITTVIINFICIIIVALRLPVLKLMAKYRLRKRMREEKKRKLKEQEAKAKRDEIHEELQKLSK